MAISVSMLQDEVHHLPSLDHTAIIGSLFIKDLHFLHQCHRLVIIAVRLDEGGGELEAQFIEALPA